MAFNSSLGVLKVAWASPQQLSLREISFETLDKSLVLKQTSWTLFPQIPHGDTIVVQMTLGTKKVSTPLALTQTVHFAVSYVFAAS